MSLDSIDDTVKKSVQDCWNVIQSQYGSKFEELNCPADNRTIRLFVSSTFRDFFNEREVLVKQVFPELREWCRDRQLKLVECDLRWGVPHDSTTRETILTCLEELDQCLELEKGQTFFLALLSERYGWIPSANDVDSEIQERYNWVPGVSITSMEIIHGALRSRSANSLFALRERTFLHTIPDRQLAENIFCDKDPLYVHHCAALKQHLRQLVPVEQLFTYEPCFERTVGADDAKPDVLLSGFDAFAEQVLKFFKQRIRDRFPPLPPPAVDDTPGRPLRLEATRQAILLREHLNAFQFRAEHVHKLFSFLQSTGTDDDYKQLVGGESEKSAGDQLDWLKLLDTWRLKSLAERGLEAGYVALVGPADDGKTQMLARLVQLATEAGYRVLYHFMDAGDIHTSSDNDQSSADMGNYHLLIGRLVNFFDQSEAAAYAADINYNELVVKLQELLQRQCERYLLGHGSEEKMLVAIDGLDLSADSGSSRHLDWLPPLFPHAHLRLLVTAASDRPPTMARLDARRFRLVRPPPLAVPEAHLFVEQFFAEFNKKLDDGQRDSLLQNAGVERPLWLTLACEELRVFGNYRQLGAKIKALPSGTVELVKSIAERVVNEDSTDSARHLLCLIYCAPEGISDSDIAQLLGLVMNHTLDTPAPYSYWAHVRRSLRVLFVVRELDGDQKISFRHNFVYQAINELYMRTRMNGETAFEYYHKQVGNFYISRLEHVSSWQQSALSQHICDHLKAGNGRRELVEFVKRDRRSGSLRSFTRCQVLRWVRCAQMVTPGREPAPYAVSACQACAHRRDGIVACPTPLINRNGCFLCAGPLLAASPNPPQAYFCFTHSLRLRPVAATTWCVFCRMMVPMNLAVPMHLCVMCHWTGSMFFCCSLE